MPLASLSQSFTARATTSVCGPFGACAACSIFSNEVSVEAAAATFSRAPKPATSGLLAKVLAALRMKGLGVLRAGAPPVPAACSSGRDVDSEPAAGASMASVKLVPFGWVAFFVFCNIFYQIAKKRLNAF